MLVQTFGDISELYMKCSMLDSTCEECFTGKSSLSVIHDIKICQLVVFIPVAPPSVIMS